MSVSRFSFSYIRKFCHLPELSVGPSVRQGRNVVEMTQMINLADMCGSTKTDGWIQHKLIYFDNGAQSIWTKCLGYPSVVAVK